MVLDAKNCSLRVLFIGFPLPQLMENWREVVGVSQKKWENGGKSPVGVADRLLLVETSSRLATPFSYVAFNLVFYISHEKVGQTIYNCCSAIGVVLG